MGLCQGSTLGDELRVMADKNWDRMKIHHPNHSVQLFLPTGPRMPTYLIAQLSVELQVFVLYPNYF